MRVVSLSATLEEIETAEKNVIIYVNCDLFVELSISQSSRVQVNKQKRGGDEKHTRSARDFFFLCN